APEPEPLPEPEPAPEPAPESAPEPEPAPSWTYETQTSLPKAGDANTPIIHSTAGGSEIPRDVLERRQLPEEHYDRTRELPHQIPAPEAPEAPAAPAAPEAPSAPAEASEPEPADFGLSTTDAGDGVAAETAAAIAAGAVAAAAAPLPPAEDDDLEATKVRRQSLLNPEVPTEPEPEATSSWIPRETPEDDDTKSIFEDATVIPEVPSRIGARVWSFLLTFVGVIAAWYLLTDAAARLTLAAGNPVATGVINPAALIELGAGAIVAIIVVLLNIRSSLGSLIFGFITMVAGGFFLAVPELTKQYMTPAYDWLTAFNDFGGNVAHHIQWTGYTGVMAVSGLILFVIGLTAIFARRDGRRDQEIRAQIEQLAPGTLRGKRKK
ncbi:MAG: hypothetical protein Q4E01_05755, partial [Actinomycetaceae bacterium]|nr:hypothetical protein [Actinomycetaceae bacterium]